MKKLINEARINEYEMLDRNPNVPRTAREIAEDAQECRQAGASVVHFHTRRRDGAPELGADACGEVIARIKDRSDILVHPTLGSLRKDLPLRERLKPILDLAAVPATRPDFLPLCQHVEQVCLGGQGLHQPDRRSHRVRPSVAPGGHWPELRLLGDRRHTARCRLPGCRHPAGARLPAVPSDQRRHAGRPSGLQRKGSIRIWSSCPKAGRSSGRL